LDHPVVEDDGEMTAKPGRENNHAAAQPGGTEITEIPLSIGGEIVVRSRSNLAHRAKSRIIGAVHGEYILIKEPVVIINERLSTEIEDDFMCSYFDSGYLYTFRSRCRQHVFKDVVCIDYPEDFEIKQIRKHRRIRVNLETEFLGPSIAKPLSGDMTDISHGGCCVIFRPMVVFITGTNGSLTFSLPNEQTVRKLKCQIVSVRNFRGRDTTEAGMKFLGPEIELDKVTAFCEFCMFFELD
jgi:c-di-GMP-binding flagellar brake protein YcgR